MNKTIYFDDFILIPNGFRKEKNFFQKIIKNWKYNKNSSNIFKNRDKNSPIVENSKTIIKYIFNHNCTSIKTIKSSYKYTCKKQINTQLRLQRYVPKKCTL